MFPDPPTAEQRAALKALFNAHGTAGDIPFTNADAAAVYAHRAALWFEGYTIERTRVRPWERFYEEDEPGFHTGTIATRRLRNLWGYWPF